MRLFDSKETDSNYTFLYVFCRWRLEMYGLWWIVVHSIWTGGYSVWTTPIGVCWYNFEWWNNKRIKELADNKMQIETTRLLRQRIGYISLFRFFGYYYSFEYVRCIWEYYKYKIPYWWLILFGHSQMPCLAWLYKPLEYLHQVYFDNFILLSSVTTRGNTKLIPLELMVFRFGRSTSHHVHSFHYYFALPVSSLSSFFHKVLDNLV